MFFKGCVAFCYAGICEFGMEVGKGDFVENRIKKK
jgi:hypothetical protein